VPALAAVVAAQLGRLTGCWRAAEVAPLAAGVAAHVLHVALAVLLCAAALSPADTKASRREDMANSRPPPGLTTTFTNPPKTNQGHTSLACLWQCSSRRYPETHHCIMALHQNEQQNPAPTSSPHIVLRPSAWTAIAAAAQAHHRACLIPAGLLAVAIGAVARHVPGPLAAPAQAVGAVAAVVSKLQPAGKAAGRWPAQEPGAVEQAFG